MSEIFSSLENVKFGTKYVKFFIKYSMEKKYDDNMGWQFDTKQNLAWIFEIYI